MNSIVAVNFERCREVARVIQDMRLPQSLVRQTLFSSDRKVVGNFNLLLVAICHQTQRIHGTVDGKLCHGWDFLERRLNRICQSNPDLLEIGTWTALTQASFERVLCQSPEGAIDMDAGPRVQLINDLGYQMTRAGYASFEQLYDEKKRRCSGDVSIVSFLKQRTRAYSDPVEKKARLLIGLLRDAHGWEFSNDRELGAPVDYHEIRGHLRIGTVVIRDKMLAAKIESDSVSEHEDHLIRDGVSSAINAIAQCSERADPLRIHYILWKYFRTICRREEPNCSARKASAFNQLDPAYAQAFERIVGSSGCAFSCACESFKEKTFEAEYSYKGTYY
jgi:hypothetical protein